MLRRSEGGPLPLPLRNRLAELILEAFEPGTARATLLALARVLAADGGSVDTADADRLLALGWFEAVAPAAASGSSARTGLTVRRSPIARDGQRRRSGSGGILDGETTWSLLGRAASLANHGLFFETHELLEPAWFKAAEPARTALQGLIQVAVGFHHLESGNRAGARSLLDLGVSKVAAAGAALPLKTGDVARRAQGHTGHARGGGRSAADSTLASARAAESTVGPEEARWRSC